VLSRWTKNLRTIMVCLTVLPGSLSASSHISSGSSLKSGRKLSRRDQSALKAGSLRRRHVSATDGRSFRGTKEHIKVTISSICQQWCIYGRNTRMLGRVQVVSERVSSFVRPNVLQIEIAAASKFAKIVHFHIGSLIALGLTIPSCIDPRWMHLL
jgi:hypothetical protein